MDNKFIVTNVEPQKKRQGRFSLYLDNKFWVGVSINTFVNLGIKVGDTYDAKEREKMEFEIKVAEGVEKMYAFLGYRDRSEKEIRDKLKEKFLFKRDERDLEEMEKEEVELIIDEVVIRLERQKLINDDEFAEQLVRNAVGRMYSKRKTNSWMYTKGLDKETINEAIENYYDDETEEEIAEKLLSKQKIIFEKKKFDEKKKKEKLQQFLMNKGFSWGLVKKLTARDEAEDVY